MADGLRVLHVITGLPIGGAQSVLSRVVAAHAAERIESEVISLVDRMEAAPALTAIGVPVSTLGLRGTPRDLASLAGLVQRIRSRPPHLVQTWLYHADLIGGLATRMAGRIPVIWNLRQSTLDRRGTKRSTELVVSLAARFSRRLPSRIVCCSLASRSVHASIGYDDSRMVVIPNGVDLDRFRPDPDARRSVRDEIGIDDSTPLIGLVARFHPQKDHETFFRALALTGESPPSPHFLLCGEGIDSSNARLREWIDRAGAGDRVHLLGERTDVPRLTAALDLATLSSAFAEGLPNSLAEAMACGVPCVATDSGDSALLIGDTGRVVPTEDPEALAAGWREILALDPERRSGLGAAARERVSRHYEAATMARRYAELYREVAGVGSGSGLPVEST